MGRSDRYIVVVILISPFVFLSGCLEFVSINQPSSILPGETFKVFIEATTNGGSEQPYFGICLPKGWTIPGDAIACAGIYNEEIIYDPNLTLEQEILSPSPDGYYWWVGDGNAIDVDAGSVYTEIQIQTNTQTGLFSIDYMLGTSPLEVDREIYGGLDQERSNNHLIDVVDEYTPRELTVSIERGLVLISWAAPFICEGLAGYNVYRDGQLINTNLHTDSEFIDEITSEGIYFYKISSLYDDGSEHFTQYEIKAIVFLNFPGGTGEPNDPYQVATSVQLVSIANDPNLMDKSFILVDDINLDPNLPGARIFEQAVIPTFSGIFDGNGHRIFDLTIKGQGDLGLFGRLSSGAEVKNMAIVDVNIVGSCDYVGGLVGYNDNSDVMACYITGKIRGSEYVGGLVGYNVGRITMSCSTVTVTGNLDIGGLVGYNVWTGSITESYGTGTVTADKYVGGLVGSNSGDITTSYGTCTVTGNETVGGLVGSNAGNITTSYSTCRVYGISEVGGLVGANYMSYVIGPIAGLIYTSYSAGTVSGESRIGGLVGCNAGSITTSYSTGSVDGVSEVGGLAGANVRVGFQDMDNSPADGMISTSYSTGMVLGETRVGGLVPRGLQLVGFKHYLKFLGHGGLRAFK